MAFSICTTLGLQMSPWKPPRTLGSRKPGEALRNPLLDFSAARYFITAIILIASTIPLKSVGLFTSLSLGTFSKYFAESVPGSLYIFFNHV